MSDIVGNHPEERHAEPAGRNGRDVGAPHCHVPAAFDPKHREALAAELTRLLAAVQWLAREIDEERGCHAALVQVAVLQADLDAIGARLVDGHLRYCVHEAVASGQGPDEVDALLVPLQSVLCARRR